MMLAGSEMNPAGEVARDNWLDVLPPSILVVPAEWDGHWDAIHCCGAPAADHVDDVGFVATVLRKVEASGGVAKRAYLAGYSNGGKLAQLVACRRPWLFRGIATFGSMPTFTCPKWKAVSELVLAGTADPEVALGPGGPPVSENGFTEPKVSTFMAWRRSANSCTSALSRSRKGGYTQQTWTHCSGGSVAEGLFKAQTHKWPTRHGSTPGAAPVMTSWFVTIDL